MKHITPRFRRIMSQSSVLVAAALLAQGCISHGSRTQSSQHASANGGTFRPSAQTEHALIQAASNWRSDFNEGNYEACAAAYTEDATLVMFNFFNDMEEPHMVATGRDEIRDWWKSVIVEDEHTNLRADGQSIQWISDSEAYVSYKRMWMGTWEEPEPAAFEGTVFAEHWVRKDGEWKVKRGITEAGYFATETEGTQGSRAEVESSLRAATAAWIDAFSAGDASYYESAYTDDATFLLLNSARDGSSPHTIAVGQTEIAEFWKTAANKPLRSKLQKDNMQIHWVNDAEAHVSYHPVSVGPKNKTSTVFREQWVNVEGAWKVRRDIVEMVSTKGK